MNSTLIRTIFAQPDRESAVGQHRDVVDQLTRIAPTVAERLNRELKGRTDVV